MKIVLGVRVDPRLRDQVEELSERRFVTMSRIVEELLSVALSDRHTFQAHPVVPNVCSVCQTHRETIRHLDRIEADALRSELEAQGMYNHPDVKAAT